MTACTNGPITLLYQASTYDIFWPVTRDRQAIPGISGGRFTIYGADGKEIVSRNPSFDYDAQELSVRLEGADSEALKGNVRYELWIQDDAGAPLIVETGYFRIIPTKTRF